MTGIELRKTSSIRVAFQTVHSLSKAVFSRAFGSVYMGISNDWSDKELSQLAESAVDCLNQLDS